MLSTNFELWVVSCLMDHLCLKAGFMNTTSKGKGQVGRFSKTCPPSTHSGAGRRPSLPVMNDDGRTRGESDTKRDFTYELVARFYVGVKASSQSRNQSNACFFRLKFPQNEEHHCVCGSNIRSSGYQTDPPDLRKP